MFVEETSFFDYKILSIYKEGGQCGQLTRCEHFWTFFLKVDDKFIAFCYIITLIILTLLIFADLRRHLARKVLIT